LIRDSEDRHPKHSSKKTERAMSTNSIFMSIVEQHLKRQAICDHVETTESAYDGLMIDEADNIQFEALLIMPISRSDIEVMKISNRPGYVWLKLLHATELKPGFGRVLSYKKFAGGLPGERCLDAKYTLDVISEELQKCISESKQMNGKVKLNCTGPVVRMEVYPNSWMLSWGHRLYTVEIVPTYKLGDDLYESRPIEGYEMLDPTTWHQSFILQERKMLCEGSKKALRILRRLRDFHNFTSYQLKTVVLHEMDVNQDWSELMLRKRLADVLERLEKCLHAKNLPHYFSPEINLLSDMPLSTMAYMCYRIQRLPVNEIEIFDFCG